MITVEQARLAVVQSSRPKAPGRRAAADCLGLVLAEAVVSDLDSPPFDKAMVDGYALRSADLIDGRGELEVTEEIMAGATAQKTGAAGQCWRIMTGAPVPAGADAVVMHEHTQYIGPAATDDVAIAGPAFGCFGQVRIAEDRFRPGLNIMRQGTAIRRGDVVLSQGQRIRPVEIGLLAEVGRTEVSVIEPPTVAILSTGNELVPAGCAPAVGQIRNSNGPMLIAAILAAGGRPVGLGIVRDEPAALREAFARGLRCDMLIVSGGVSAGALDLVPGLLKELGVAEVFHKIRMKPGKPLWFGTRARVAGESRPDSVLVSPPPAPVLVFGLPGNPVSGLVCFELFVRPAIARLSGRDVPEVLPTRLARLLAGFVHRGDRPTFHPAILSSGHESTRAEMESQTECQTVANSLSVTPLPWAGAADLRGLSAANALAIFPAGDREYSAGEQVETVPLP